MEDCSKHRHAPLVPKGQSATSIVLNGMGNGAMLAAIPAFVVKLGYEFATKKQPDRKGEIAVAIFTGIGGLIGAYHGKQEANTTLHYRAEVANKANHLQEQIDRQQDKIAELYKAVQAKESHAKAR